MKSKKLAPGKSNCCVEFVKAFDFYKDLPDSLSEPTLTGAGVSMVLMVVVGLLLSSSVWKFLQFQKTSEIMVDVNASEEKLHINLDITLPKCPCNILSLDVVDITGVHLVDIEGKLVKHRLDAHGKLIGTLEHIGEEGHVGIDPREEDFEYTRSQEYKNKIDNVVRDTVKALDDMEGCKLSGFVFINKVPGNFHISGHHYPEAVRALFMKGHKLDFSHKINHLSFGALQDAELIKQHFGETIENELDGRDID